MDNNNQQITQPQANQQYAQPQANQQYAQPQMNQQYAQPQMNQQYAQPQMNQQYAQPQMNQQYAQPQYGQQMYGQPQYGYQQAPKQPNKAMENIKDVQNQFKKKVSKMGLSTFCLIGIIAAMLLIFGPFLNFASAHYSDKVDIGKKVKISVSDGLNLFELSKASNTVNRVCDKLKVDKKDIIEELDDFDTDDVIDAVEYETDVKVKKGVVNEGLGIVYLLLKGTAALMITPWLIIISGIGLLVFTVINNKKLKLVFSIIPLACLLILILCSSHFFAMMGLGAWVIVLGSAGGIVSAIKDV